MQKHTVAGFRHGRILHRHRTASRPRLAAATIARGHSHCMPGCPVHSYAPRADDGSRSDYLRQLAVALSKMRPLLRTQVLRPSPAGCTVRIISLIIFNTFRRPFSVSPFKSSISPTDQEGSTHGCALSNAFSATAFLCCKTILNMASVRAWGRVVPLQSWLTAPGVMRNCRATSA